MKQLIGCIFIAAFTTNVVAQTLSRSFQEEGFTEPIQSVELACVDSGVIAELNVREGSQVQAGELICRLESGVIESSLAAAETKLNSQGKLQAAQATVDHRRNRVQQMRSLHARSHASEQEVTDAELDLALAEAQLQSVLDERRVLEMEVAQIESQLRRRSVIAPISGVVLELPKQVGESVTASNSVVAKIVQLDRLRVRYFLSTTTATNVKTGLQLPLHLTETEQFASGLVEFVSPVTDANSGTVRVELLIDNQQQNFRSGLRCHLRSLQQVKPNDEHDHTQALSPRVGSSNRGTVGRPTSR